MNRIARHTAIIAIMLWPALTAASPCQSLEAARWILGDWISGDDKSSAHESWTETSPQTFEGSGSNETGSDAAVNEIEALRLVEMAGEVFYMAKLSHDELPVAFRLTACGAGLLIFENPAHDHPRRIEYREDAAHRMVVAVSDRANKSSMLAFERRAIAADAGAVVLAAEDARFGAMVQADVTQLGDWLADDLQYAHSTGKVESRQQFLDSIASGRTRYLTIEPIERQAVLLGDRSALVRGRGRFQVMAADNRLDLQLRYLAVYAKSDGRWRLQSWQSMRLPQ